MAKTGALFSVADVVRWTGGRLLQGDDALPLNGMSNDSRALEEGDLFVALVAERDGHDFVPQALAARASALLVSRPVEGVDAAVAVVQIPDTLKGMGAIAAGYRRCFPNLKVVGVTGSNGKTTTKEMVASILRHMGSTLATAGNYNNLIGLPLTLMELRADHRYAVLEMGMNAFGEIAQLAHIAAPQVGGITCVAAAHLEGVGSLEGVAQAKGELWDALGNDAWAIVNADDPLLLQRSHALACRKLYVSAELEHPELPEGAPSVRLASLESRGADGFRFAVEIHDWDESRGAVPASIPVNLPLVGRHQVSNAAMAIGATLALGASSDAIVQGLATVAPTGRRMRLVGTAHGVHLIDDCYNSNPHSCSAALRTLEELAEGATRVAVIGDMLELGQGEREAHLEVGRMAAGRATHVLAFGPLAAAVAEGAREGGLAPENVSHATTIEALAAQLQPLLREGVWVLVKASRGMRLERISEAIAQGAVADLVVK